ncbi:SusC/RagA family TonB-linked outer membrane protein [Chitinophaga pendula]|uniref:SusC/RagA family TonB-linked outer membrane protein n=1 Tax=Chitinophaga pendula TaxID=2849666 RepID=UPI000BB0CAD3|nr:SusC/RagA family TonB-linked outer membrane protein [Chitinophaga pendula]ASZ10660.1 SusC/RagA family TonB-linked outer membrane protein [Chitinophaga sp. MD30]UCJ06364.1 SusC/RagA family TonB-linked outer membrane protein [Chitinophaga pendula]
MLSALIPLCRKHYYLWLLCCMLLSYRSAFAGDEVQWEQGNNPTLTLGFTNASVLEAFRQITVVTGMQFSYNKEDIDTGRRIRLVSQKRKLTELLDAIGQQVHLKFTQVNKTIAVSVPEPEQLPASAAGPMLTPLMATDTVPAGVGNMTIKGRITTARNEPLPGVTVKVKGSNAGAVTNGEGYYTLSNISRDAMLIYSFVGYLQQEERVSGRQTIDVQLQEDTRKINEVVVTALGIKRQKKEVGYSTEKVTGVEIAQAAAPNIVNALSGKMAGVNVVQPGGVEGGKTRITIRGNTSIKGNNEPLIVIDGLQFENDGGISNSIESGKDWGSAINNIDPNDIESIDVLKGPTAAALYGARGANGVIMITTKKGRNKKGLGIEYAGEFKLTKANMFRDVQNEFGMGGPAWGDVEPRLLKNSDGENVLPKFWGQSHTGDGNTATSLGKRATWENFSWYYSGLSWGPRLDGSPVRWWDGQVRSFSPQPDNVSLFFKTGTTIKHNVSFSNAGDFGSFRVSLGRMDNDAVVPNSNFSQTSVNIGASLKISSRLKADVAMNYLRYDRKNSPTLGSDANSWGYQSLYGYPREWRPIERDTYENPDGSKNAFNNYPNMGKYTSYADYIGTAGSPGNFWWNTYNNNTFLGRDKIFGTITLNYEATSWLNVMGRLGIDRQFDLLEYKNKPTSINGITDGKYGINENKLFVQNHEFLVTAHKENILPDFNVRLSVGGSTWQRKINNFNASTGNNNWSAPWVYALNNVKDKNALELADITNLGYGLYNKKLNSLMGLLDLSYRDMLFLQLSARNDWASTLPKGANSYLYPSATLSWVFTELESLKGMKGLSFGKLRLAYSNAARDADPYKVTPTYGVGTSANQLVLSLPVIVPASNLKNETTRGMEAGVQLGFLDGRLNLDMAYYRNRSYNQLLTSNLPLSSGAGQFLFNSGVLQNTGLEVILDAKILDRKEVSWNSGLRLSNNKTRVVALDPKVQYLSLGDLWGRYGPSINVKEGDTYGTIYGYDYQYDASGRKLVSDDGTRYLTTAEKVPIGNANPKLTGGWTNTISYRGITLSVLTDFKWGGDIFAGSYAYGVFSGQSPTTLAERNGGGLPYTDADGVTRNVGVILDGVTRDGKVNDKVVHYLWKYMGNIGSGWGNWSIKEKDPVTGAEVNKEYGFLHKPAIFDNSWVKLREVSISYQVPSKVVQRWKVIQGLSVYVTGRDLFYIYKNLPDNINPEGSISAGNAQGFEWGGYPNMRSFALGVRLSL